MTANEYAAMYRAVPAREGLAAVGNAFLQEASERAGQISTADGVKALASAMVTKWQAFCEQTADMSPQPQPNAYDGLEAMLLSRRGL